MIIVLVSIRI